MLAVNSVRSLPHVVNLPLIRANPTGRLNAKLWDLALRIIATLDNLSDLPSMVYDSPT